jgi:hypothetical protein
MVSDHKIIISPSQVKCMSFLNKEWIILPLSIEVLSYLNESGFSSLGVQWL